MVVATGTGLAASEVGFDTGIGLWNVCDATVVHNTVVSAVETYDSIEYRFGRTQARVVNNLVTNEILDRDDAGVPVAGNAIVELSEFVDPLGGDVHLVDGASAIDAGVQLGDDRVLHDSGGDPRDVDPTSGPTSTDRVDHFETNCDQNRYFCQVTASDRGDSLVTS